MNVKTSYKYQMELERLFMMDTTPLAPELSGAYQGRTAPRKAV